MAIFETNGNEFVYEGQPVRLVSGAVHYFRIVPEYWRDRLLKLKACGFNAVETYVPWNYHEPRPGEFRFEGMADIVRFVETAGELGLMVIVRPSPYICAEWEFGGLPAWLLADPGMRLRCFHQPFLDRVDAYYDALLPLLKPLLCTNGGPIVAMQIENEYGSYGNDQAYLNYLKEGMLSRGMDVLLFTSDGPEHPMLQGGMIPGVLETVNFGSNPKEAFRTLREYQPEGPLMCMEFWNGWFDHWGEEHHTRDAEDVAGTLDEMLGLGASVNFYMFHGGTNFGYTSGANCHVRDKYEPNITSYDYDVPLNERGEPTAKFEAVRRVLEKHLPADRFGPLPEPIAPRAYGAVEMKESAELLDRLDAFSAPIRSPYPKPMEELGQNDGFILYSTFVSGPRASTPLIVQELRDRAQVFVDGRREGTLERWNEGERIELAIPAGGVKLDILVENMGRVNYGPYLADRKGITEGVRLGNAFLSGWEIRPLPLDELPELGFREGQAVPSGRPAFFRGRLTVEGSTRDTFLRLDGWTKGSAYVNGFHLGRYWNRGPQRTLYVPAPLLREGDNEIVLFELEGTDSPIIAFTDKPELG